MIPIPEKTSTNQVQSTQYNMVNMISQHTNFNTKFTSENMKLFKNHLGLFIKMNKIWLQSHTSNLQIMDTFLSLFQINNIEEDEKNKFCNTKMQPLIKWLKEKYQTQFKHRISFVEGIHRGRFDSSSRLTLL